MIELHEVTHRYGERVVLRDLSLCLEEPRIGVIGANGSGKSTFARLLNGLVVPTAGRVVVAGHDTRRDAAAVRRRVGFVFTDPDAQIVMPTVAEDVAFSLRRQRLTAPERDRRVTEVLERFGLAAHADQPAHLLSGGQKQLLALAAVLVTEPEVLVCDEPTTLLDLRNSHRVARLLRELPQQVVLVTHHLDLVEDYDRVLVVDEGRLVHDGTPDSSVAFYRDLVGSRPADGAVP
jgi:biotin transport system ATP-binding protein